MPLNLHKDYNIIILRVKRGKDERGNVEITTTHLEEHEFLLTFCNAILDRRAFSNAPLRRKSRPPREVVSIQLHTRAGFKVVGELNDDEEKKREGRRLWRIASVWL